MARPQPHAWTPTNFTKYKGDYKNIVVRSSWETKVCIWLDKNDAVLAWASEEIVVPYISPVDGKYHRYFVDFWAKIQTKDGVKTYLIEVKPKKQTMEPVVKKRITRQYIAEVTTWAVNQAKWEAATNYCLDRKWEFKILTEDHLFGTTK